MAFERYEGRPRDHDMRSTCISEVSLRQQSSIQHIVHDDSQQHASYDEEDNYSLQGNIDMNEKGLLEYLQTLPRKCRRLDLVTLVSKFLPLLHEDEAASFSALLRPDNTTVFNKVIPFRTFTST